MVIIQWATSQECQEELLVVIRSELEAHVVRELTAALDIGRNMSTWTPVEYTN